MGNLLIKLIDSVQSLIFMYWYFLIFKVAIAAVINSCTSSESLLKCQMKDFYIGVRIAYLNVVIAGFLFTLLAILFGMLGYETPKKIVIY